MQRLFYFNPENDLALANGCTNYLPPRSALQLKKDLSLLPLWYAEKTDIVWLGPDQPKPSPDEHIRKLCPAILLGGTDLLPEQAEWHPWGWNPALVKQLLRMGIPAEQLPSDEAMTNLRNLSSRELATRVLKRLLQENIRTSLLPLFGESFVCHNEDEIRRIVESYPCCMLKAPWSGSGKGLRRAYASYEPPLCGWCRNIVKTQGCVIVEPYYLYKAWDLAVEFYAPGDGAPIEFVGYSLFQTDANGAYKGNILATDETICRFFDEQVFKRPVLEQTVIHLQHLLSQEIGSAYKGFLGVDMMVCNATPQNESPTYKLHPCVEVNLRMNMGIVAHNLTRRLLPQEAVGTFRIVYQPQPAGLLDFCQKKRQENPPLLTNGNRLQQGFLNLTPVTADTQYLAYVELLLPVNLSLSEIS